MAVTDAVKLDVYNRALIKLGSRRLSSLTENREPRRVLDTLWGPGDAVVEDALELADWNFATRTIQMDHSPSIEPDFGFKRVFAKPDDLARLTTIASDEFLKNKLIAEQYSDEAQYWFTSFDTIYVKYVSTLDEYGFNDAAWGRDFKNYLSAYLAHEACERITNSVSRKARLATEMIRILKINKSHDAMAEGTKRLPSGSWVNARSGDNRYGSER
jgi:hypothetical protein